MNNFEILGQTKKELELSIKQIEDALNVLDDKKHAAAKICLAKSLEIIKFSLDEIERTASQKYN